MTDNVNPEVNPEIEETQAMPPVTDGNTPMTELTRVFKIGSTRIVENDTTRGKAADAVQSLLKAAYPEVANATIRERTEGEYQVVEFLPQPGRKG